MWSPGWQGSVAAQSPETDPSYPQRDANWTAGPLQKGPSGCHGVRPLLTRSCRLAALRTEFLVGKGNNPRLTACDQVAAEGEKFRNGGPHAAAICALRR